MASSILRSLNSTDVPLIANGRFIGSYEFAGSLLTAVVNCYASTNIRVEIFENAVLDTTMEVAISTTTIPRNTLQDIQVKLSFPYFKIIVTNLEATLQSQMNINTVYTNLLPLSDVPLDVVITGSLPAGTNTIGNVNTLNSFNETILDIGLISIGVPYISNEVDIRQYSLWDYELTCSNATIVDDVVFQVQISSSGTWITLATIPFTSGVAYFLNQQGAGRTARIAILNPTANYIVNGSISSKG